MEFWPHQRFAIEQLSNAINEGTRRILLTSPTGGGKSEIMFAIVKWGFPCVFYLNRKMLLEQFAARLEAAGIKFGVRAADYEPRLLENVQLSSVQSEGVRTFKRGKWKLHDARIAFFDEAHVQTGETAQRIMRHHVAQGNFVIGATATPLDLGPYYDRLIVAGNNTELRHCGALLPSVTFAPSEPAAPKLKATAEGKYTDDAVAKAMGKRVLTGNIFHNWKRLNPEAKPAIGFACSVGHSLGHAQEFHKRGVGAAHIDGSDTWINGEWYFSDQAAREQLKAAVESGEVAVVWNRFVLREGIDWPFIYHGIFATIFGSMQTYLQAGGRVLRNHSSLERVIFQDHGGNWWRYGSLNSDRVWRLNGTHRIQQGERELKLREKKEPEPIQCVKCHAVRTWGRECPECGHVGRVKVRYIEQTDGRLSETQGDIYQPRRVTRRPSAERKWESMIYRARNSKSMTFRQAEALFMRENNGTWPSPEFGGMPKFIADRFLRVRDVPPARLRPFKQWIENDANQML